MERGEQGVHQGLGHSVELEAKQKGWSDVWVVVFDRLSQPLSAK